ncbi:hypothetical protein AVEN_208357-1 [Araneus ventricosus]|uniref:Uncharacterized protein n=1 Tax=Araneus ventricosus TaxID=182803 RepID=A0A4Y2FCT6_ARAVE|nr:hypothetical protein AVEN_208357-1 [Araneus ventricosus]
MRGLTSLVPKKWSGLMVNVLLKGSNVQDRSVLKWTFLRSSPLLLPSWSQSHILFGTDPGISAKSAKCAPHCDTPIDVIFHNSAASCSQGCFNKFEHPGLE